jgi:hypothetical protein
VRSTEAASRRRRERMVDKSDMFYLDPDQVRKVEILHEPPSRERVRVTIEYRTGELRLLTVHKSVLEDVLEDVYSAESET